MPDPNRDAAIKLTLVRDMRQAKEAANREAAVVTRFVATYINSHGHRTLMTPAQGRHTFETEAEAQAWIDAATTNNGSKTIHQLWGDDPRFEPRACPCWPVHFDPKTCWFD